MKFGPIPNAKKYVFSPIQPKKWGGGGGHMIQIQNILLHIYNFTELKKTITVASFSPFSPGTLINIQYIAV